MWPMNSEIYFLTITRALYLPWEMWTLWSQKCNYFTYHCSKKNDRKRIQAFFVRRSKSVICGKSTQFAENWRWHSSLDRVGMGWEFQQITKLWIRVVYLRAKCKKRLSVIRKKQRRIKKTSKTYMWQFVNRRAHQRWNIALHATTKRTSASIKSQKFSYSSRHMKQNYSIFPTLKIAL